jgi:DNA-binding beta-propeller fold protein YncE
VPNSGDSRRPEDVRDLRAGLHPAHAPAPLADLAGRLACLSLALLAALLSALALASAPALALTQRGHVFSFSFGASGRGEGQFQHPSGIAVNNLTGDVYVADRNDNRVEEFKPVLNPTGELTGEKYVGAFTVPYPVGLAVDNSTEATDPSKGDVYVVGANGEEKKEAKPEGFWVYKFSAGGEAITKLKKIKIKEGKETFEEELEEIKGVAVDPGGSLFVSQEEEIYRFDNQEKNKGASRVLSGAGEAEPGLAVDSEGDLYVGTAEPQGVDAFEEELTEELKEEGEQAGLFEEFDVIAKLAGATGKVRIPELDPEYTTAVAVNPAEEPGNDVSELNDVYLNNVASVGGEEQTTVAAFNPQGGLIQRFGAPGLKDGAAVAVDSASGAVYVADAQADAVDVFALEPHGPPTVAGLSACTLGSTPGCPAAPDATKLNAQVDPTGADTHYKFEYGAGRCAAVPPTCTTTPETDVGEGFADQGASVELQNLPTGIYHYRIVASNELGTVRSAERTFTILASASALPDAREWEMVSPPIKHGAEPEAMPESGGEIQASENGNAITYIADGPMGSEPEGNRNPESTQVLSTRGPQGWSSQDITTPNNNVVRGLLVGRVGGEYQAFSTDLALALVEPFPGPEGSGPLAEPPLSPSLSQAERGHQEQTMYLRADAPEGLLKPEASEAENYKQAKEDGEQMTPRNAGYLALVSGLNAPGGEPFGGSVGKGVNNGLEFSLAATPDLGHVAFYSHRAAPGIYEWGPAGSCSGSTLCTGGDVQPVSVLPGGTPAEEFHLGGALGHDVRHAISNDGALVFWSGGVPGKTQHLYVRDTVTQETLQLDALQPGASGAGEPNPQFQTASADGSKVFFTDTQRLNADSKAGTFSVAMPDLYVAELSGAGAPGMPLSVTVTDLTPQGTNGESADIQMQGGEGGGVLGASEDGSYVYFVADGALAPGATRGYCSPLEEERPAGTTCNLYVRHYDGSKWTATKLIAALSDEDLPDWDGIGVPGALDFMTSRVSPNGQYLAFMSNRSLTGYDNEDVTSEKPGERLDEEVYLYDASSERLACASCNPTGARPAGVFDPGAEAESEEGAGLLVDRLDIWSSAYSALADHWLAGSVPGWTPLGQSQANYQSRYLSNSGRLFFNSPDQLVPAASGVKEKVYEYEPSGVGSCHREAGCVGLISSASSEYEAAFLDASASGNDVFFLTPDRLVQQDVDANVDIYDAHVCEASAPCLPPPAGGSPPCGTVKECRPGSSSSSPALEAPASTSTSGSGNIAQQQVLPAKESKPPPKPLTRAQKLAKALKACKKDKKKKTRLACEKQARGKYGPIKSKAKKSPRKGK